MEKGKRGDRVAKVPFATNGKSCGTNDIYRDIWVPYAETQQAVARRKADGVGFRIPKGMFFLDIDHRDLNDPMAQEILALLNSYTEFSVSGEGIHIYGLCDVAQLPTSDGKLHKDYYTHHPDNGLELYNRRPDQPFFRLHGERYSGSSPVGLYRSNPDTAGPLYA